MNAIIDSEVMPMTRPPSPSWSHEPSFFWMESRCFNPLSIAFDAAAVSSGASSAEEVPWAIRGEVNRHVTVSNEMPRPQILRPSLVYFEIIILLIFRSNL